MTRITPQCLKIASEANQSCQKTNSVYVFTIFFDEMIFTTCGRAGAHGPTVAECRNYYSGHSWTKDYFRMDKPGYQKFIIPRQGMYKFTVYGAGHTGSYRAYGAKVETVMYLHKMQEIELIVGQVRVKFCF